MVIDVYVGAPGQGKSYCLTAIGVNCLKKKIPVYSNYPIVLPDGRRSMIWKKEYAVENITDSYILIDEAWKDFNSNNWKEISLEEHEFFAESRHHRNYIILATQSTARIATLIKEIGEIIKVQKINLFYFILIGFHRYYYATLDEYNARFYAKGDEIPYYKHDFLLFNKTVAQSYDSWVSKRHNEKPFKGELWPMVPREKQSILFRIRIMHQLSRDFYLQFCQLLDPTKYRNSYFVIRYGVYIIIFISKQKKAIINRLIWELKHTKIWKVTSQYLPKNINLKEEYIKTVSDVRMDLGALKQWLSLRKKTN